MYAAQAARPPALEERSDLQTQAQVTVSHRPPFLSRSGSTAQGDGNLANSKLAAHHQNHPLVGDSCAHQCGARESAQKETLEDALEQLL